MRVDVVSDTVCPWCWIGKRKFERALSLRPDLRVEVTWHPYQLDPSLPPEGADHRARLAAKFGGMARVDAAFARVTEIGRAVGLEYHFDKIVRTPNSLDTHVLVRLAQARGGSALQNALVERFFRAYFSEGEDLTDRTTLVRLAAEVGLPDAEIEGRLADASARAAVQAEADGWRRAGISGVPTFIFDGKYAVSGAQEPETFVNVLDRVASGRGAGVGV